MSHSSRRWMHTSALSSRDACEAASMLASRHMLLDETGPASSINRVSGEVILLVTTLHCLASLTSRAYRKRPTQTLTEVLPRWLFMLALVADVLLVWHP